MKKLVLMAIATVFMLCFTYAGNTPANNVNNKKIITAMQKSLKYPAFAKEKQIESFVYLNIAVDKKGKIKVNEIYSPNQELADYVLQETKKMVVKDFKSDQTYDMEIVFKLEK